MDTFDVTILGCSSALPAFGRNPSAQLVHVAGRYFLIDCGEGTQMQLRKYSLKFQRISHIFISHLHGDHYLGLPGLLSTMHLLGRLEPLHIYSPQGLKEIIEINHNFAGTVLQYPIIYHNLDTNDSKLIFEDEKITIRTIILKHSIACCGFIFEEKEKPRKLIKEKLLKFDIPIAAMESLKKGLDYAKPDGTTIPNNDLTEPPPHPHKYCYCSDTVYNEDNIPLLKNADVIYHEATFMEDMKERAAQTMHSTAKDAAIIAKEANAKKLIIGHYSARYKELEPLLNEAQSIFPETYLAEDGKRFNIGY